MNVLIPILTTRLCITPVSCTAPVHKCAEKVNRMR